MPLVRTLDVLRDARRLVADPKTWTSGHYALTPEGSYSSWDEAGASCFCAEGAVLHSCRQRGLTFTESEPLVNALDRIARRDFQRSALVLVNDFIGREAALAVIDAAIAELEAGEKQERSRREEWLAMANGKDE